MGRTLVSLCKWFVGVVLVQPVAILRAEFCMTCSEWWLVSEVLGDHAVDPYEITGRTNCLYSSVFVSFC